MEHRAWIVSLELKIIPVLNINHCKKPKKLNGSKNQIHVPYSISDSGLCSLKIMEY